MVRWARAGAGRGRCSSSRSAMSAEPATTASSIRWIWLRRLAVLGEETFGIAELEHREHQPLRRGHDLAAVDVHAEVGQHAGDVAEQERLVERDHREPADVAVLLERRVDFVRQDPARQPQVAVDGREAEHREIRARQPGHEARPARCRRCRRAGRPSRRRGRHRAARRRWPGRARAGRWCRCTAATADPPSRA